MATTDSIEKPVSTDDSPLEGPESLEPGDSNERDPGLSAPRSAWPPIAWVGVGLVLGIGGALAVLTPHRVNAATGPGLVVANTPPAPVDKSLPLPTIPPSARKPDVPATVPNLNGSATEKPLIMRPMPTFPPFGPRFVIPKAPGELPVQPPPLRGKIFGGPLPTLPSVSLAPMPAPNPVGAIPPTKGAPAVPTAPTSLPGSRGGNAAYLQNLLAHGVPKPPPGLNTQESVTAPAPVVPTSHGPAKLVAINELAADRNAAVQAVTSYVQKAGGNAKPLSQMVDGKSTLKGMLVAVPNAGLDDFLKFLAGTGQVRDRESWSGTANARRAKLTEDADAQVASLTKLREALLGTYLPDSDPVKDTDAQIAAASDFAKSLLPPDGTDGMTLVRISFVAY